MVTRPDVATRPVGWRLPAMTDVLAVIADQLDAAGAWFVPVDQAVAVSSAADIAGPDAAGYDIDIDGDIDAVSGGDMEKALVAVREWLDRGAAGELTTSAGNLRVEAVALHTELVDLQGALVVASDGTAKPDMQRTALIDLAAALLETAAESAPLLAARRQLVDWVGRARSVGRAAFAVSVDGLAITNEVLGLRAGDLLLDTLAGRIAEWVGPHGRVTPSGGARYLAVRTDIETDARAVHEADLLRELIAAPVDIDGLPVTWSASVGVAADPHCSVDPETLLSNALRCGAAARASGGDRSVLYDVAATRALLDRLRLTVGLYGALVSDQLRMHYQPEFDLVTGDVVAVEALLRWQHPELGLLSAESFVPDAESTRSFTAVQHWVLEESCRQLADWRRDGLADGLQMRVNVPGNLVVEADLTATLSSALSRYAIPGEMVCVELTERRMPDDLDALSAELSTWRELGVRLALDDFGVGTATLTHLLSLPVDVVKIDQSFVSRVPGDLRATAIVRSIIDLATALGLDVVAEGVGDDATAAELVRFGCTFGQGNALAPALPPDDVAELVAARRR